MFKYKKYKDMAAIISYEGNDKIVIIPSEIDGLKVHRIASMTFFCNDEIEEIHFPENVTIENNVIISCDNLKRIFVKDFKTMGNFIEDCEDLEVICDSERTQKKLSKLFNFDWVSIKRLISFGTIENEDGTLTISNIYIPKGEMVVEIPDYINGKKVTKLVQNLFYRKSLKKVILNNFIKEIPSCCFLDVEELEEVENTDNIEVIGKRAFASCYNLYLNLENMKNLKKIEEKAFYYNRGIRSIKINKGVEIEEGAFLSMDRLKVLDLSNYDKTIIPKNLCQSCGELEKVILPEHNVSIKDYAFAYCYGLANIENEDYIREVEKEGFYACRKLVLGIDGSNLRKVGDNAFRDVSFREDLKLGDVELEPRAFLRINAFLRDTINVTFTKNYKSNIIPGYLFAYSYVGTIFFETIIDVVDECAFFKSFIKKLVNASFKEIRSNAFSNSDIEEFVADERLEKLGRGAFNQCYKLTIIDLEKANLSSLEDGIFAGNDAIKTLKLPNRLTTLSRIFYNTKLGELVLPDSIEEIESDSFRHSKIERLVLGKNIKKIPRGCFYNFVGNIEVNGVIDTIEAEAFYNAKLKELDLSKATMKEIPYSCFYGMTCDLVKLPNTLEKINDYAFTGAVIKSLESNAKLKHIGNCSFSSINIENYNFDFSNVKTIGQRAFYYTFMPKELTLRDVSIGLEAFYNTTNLLNVIILGDSIIERKNFEDAIFVHIQNSKLRNKVKNRTYFKLNPNLIQKIK